MDESKSNKIGKRIEIKKKSKKEFFLLHGYTGSPTDFNELGKYLSNKFNANVKIIKLKGHGEKIENITNLNYNDFLFQAEDELKKDIEKGMKIIIGGISIGSFIALHLSSKYPVKGIINISIPYKNRLFTSIVTFFEPVIFKKHWKKRFTPEEKELRKKAFFYDTNIRGLKIIKQGKKELKKVLKKINIPSLIIHVKEDRVFHPKSAKIVGEKINSKIKDILIFKTEGKAGHNPFFSPNHEELYKIIGDFVEKNKLFKK